MEQTPQKQQWDTPEMVALTESDARADRPDISVRNGGLASNPV